MWVSWVLQISILYHVLVFTVLKSGLWEQLFYYLFVLKESSVCKGNQIDLKQVAAVI